jgi:tetratricopeptide (TPR) repeat protein
MGRPVCKLFLLLYLPVASSVLLRGQAQVGSVVGSIQVVRGDFPSHPILVELQLHQATISSAYCDNQGRFGFYGLGSNLYHVVVKDDEYNPVDEQANLNLMASAQAVVQIRLIPKEHLKKDPVSDRVKGSNPFLVDSSEYNRHFDKKAVKEFQKGVEADQRGKREDAIQHYQVALRLAPDYYPAHNNLGSDYLSKADLQSAQVQFEEAIRLNQNDAQAYFNLGNVFVMRGRYPEAEHVLEEGMKRLPDSAFGQFLFGSLYSRTGRLPEAEQRLRQALQLDPSMSQAHLQLVNLYLEEKRTPDAIGELRSYLKAFPDGAYAPRAREMLKKLETDSSVTIHR